MSIALDGGTATNVNDYAPSRNASGVVWTSPTLPSGNHTLTITNTGQRNPSSSGNNIAIDRADITTAASQSIVDGNVTGTGSNQFQYGANWGVKIGRASCRERV